MRSLRSQQPSPQNRTWGLLLTVTLVLLVPIVPFLIWHESIDLAWEAWVTIARQPRKAMTLIIATLATDILLPIPSSAVATYAGATLGWPMGSLAVWVGLCISAMLGYGLAAILGRPVVDRLTNETTAEAMTPIVTRYGSWLLLLSRPIPVIAESAVLVCGLQRMGWARTFWPIAFGNAGFAIALCGLGEAGQKGQWFTAAMVLSVVAPSVLFFGAMRALNRPTDS